MTVSAPAESSTSTIFASRPLHRANWVAYCASVPDTLTDAVQGDDLWAAADALPLAGRELFASTRLWPRPADDAVLSAWLAVNCIREWRGGTMIVRPTIDRLAER